MRTIGFSKDVWRDLDVNYAIANALSKTYSIVKQKIIEYFNKYIYIIFMYLTQIQKYYICDKNCVF